MCWSEHTVHELAQIWSRRSRFPVPPVTSSKLAVPAALCLAGASAVICASTHGVNPVANAAKSDTNLPYSMTRWQITYAKCTLQYRMVPVCQQLAILTATYTETTFLLVHLIVK